MTSTSKGKVHPEDIWASCVYIKRQVLTKTAKSETITAEEQEDLAREEQGENSDSDREFLAPKRQRRRHKIHRP